jgi:hypothetical protein
MHARRCSAAAAAGHARRASQDHAGHAWQPSMLSCAARGTGRCQIRRAWARMHGACIAHLQAQARLQPREGACWLVHCVHASQAGHRANRERVDAVQASACCAREDWCVSLPLQLGSWHARPPPVAASCSTRAAHACRRCPGWTKASGAQQPSAPAGMVLRQLQAEGCWGARAAWRRVGVGVRSRVRCGLVVARGVWECGGAHKVYVVPRSLSSTIQIQTACRDAYGVSPDMTTTTRRVRRPAGRRRQQKDTHIRGGQNNTTSQKHRPPARLVGLMQR